MENRSFVLRGDICWSDRQRKLHCAQDAYLVCENGRCAGVFDALPQGYAALPLIDHRGKLVIPGMADLHIHAPQYAFRGLGMDLELLDWLQQYAFPEEAKYNDLEYAKAAYRVFADNLRRSATTRISAFATVHLDATVLLMELLEEAGIAGYVGKVNMDREAPDELREPDAAHSAALTMEWLQAVKDKCTSIRPILTPRFLPSCSDALLEKLQEIRKDWELPVQSHLSENPGEVAWVAELFPKAAFYGDGYDRYGLFGKDAKTVMAHCVYCSEEEMQRMQDNGVFVAHCPASNMNLSSGIAPIRRFLERGIRVGLGSDVAGGESESIFRAISDAIQVSKLYWRYVDSTAAPLSFEEAFYLATLGGGEFFGAVGSFLPGYAFDAVVLEDAPLNPLNTLSLPQRLERAVYLEADGKYLREKYVDGACVFSA